MFKNSITVMTVLLLSLLSSASYALSCKGRIVHVGDHQAEVLNKCGEPTYTIAFEKEFAFFEERPESHRVINEIRKTVLVEEWTYNFGRQRLMRILTFHNGRLVEIETAGRGFNQ